MKNRRNVSNKTVAILLALVLAIGCAVGGTLAWLISQTNPVVNTFTYGDINIDLKEDTKGPYTITPGKNITKDPKVTVKANSEACWLFVKVKEENWPTFTDADGTKKVSYHIADGWNALQGQTDVYYREVAAANDKAQEFPVLKDNTVTVRDTLTKDEVNKLKNSSKPTQLTFTAYAVQKDSIATAAEAWAKIPATTTTNP